eukprot:comp13477_c2_seq1/m.9012 comp13477_c2_seq1/g.9012  ORF comp13477_c2_seq1/g.9012 comp13477_c2_seq1/m.9012 type:complete len:165 (-) comp13477_c2_seq1:246-740(-)
MKSFGTEVAARRRSFGRQPSYGKHGSDDLLEGDDQPIVADPVGNTRVLDWLPTARPVVEPQHRDGDSEWLVVTVPRPEGKLAASFGVKFACASESHEGVVVVERLFHECPAEKAGLKVGDEIAEVNGEEVRNAAKAKGLMDRSPRDTVLVVRRRKGNPQGVQAQ